MTGWSTLLSVSAFSNVLRGHTKGIIASAAAIVALVVLIVTVTYSAARAAEADAHTASVHAAKQAAVADTLRHDQLGYREALGQRLTAEQKALAEQAAQQAAAEAAAAAAAAAAAEQAASDDSGAGAGAGAGEGSSTSGGADTGAGDQGGSPAPTEDATTLCPPPSIAHTDDDGNLLWCEAEWQCAQRDDDGTCTAWML